MAILVSRTTRVIIIQTKLIQAKTASPVIAETARRPDGTRQKGQTQPATEVWRVQWQARHGLIMHVSYHRDSSLVMTGEGLSFQKINATVISQPAVIFELGFFVRASPGLQGAAPSFADEPCSTRPSFRLGN